MLALRQTLSTECQGGSYCGSQIGCGHHIRKDVPRYMIAHSKPPMGVHDTVLDSLRGSGDGRWEEGKVGMRGRMGMQNGVWGDCIFA